MIYLMLKRFVIGLAVMGIVAAFLLIKRLGWNEDSSAVTVVDSETAQSSGQATPGTGVYSKPFIRNGSAGTPSPYQKID